MLLIGGVGQIQASAQVAGPAAPPPLEVWIIEHRPQEGHAAGWARIRRGRSGAEPLVGDHRLLLGPTRGVDSRVALSVIGPGQAGGLPATTYPAYGAVDVKDLEHGLQPGAP